MVDKLCPALSESGSIVTYQPVEGYPLSVVSQIVPAQEGSGDPSPENVRPITGRTEAKLSHCGKNLLSNDFQEGNYEEKYYMLDLPPGNYCVWAEIKEGVTSGYVYLEKSTDGGVTWKSEDIGVVGKGSWNSNHGYIIAGTQKFRVAFTVTGAENEKWALWAGASKQHLGAIEHMQIEVNAEPGNPVKTAYEPYRGDYFTMDLGQEVYGGSFDWNTGVLTIDTIKRSFDGTETYWTTCADGDNFSGAGFTLYTAAINPRPVRVINPDAVCSHFPTTTERWNLSEPCYRQEAHAENCLRFAVPIECAPNKTVAEWKTWLAGQASAGTPLAITYKVTEPTVVQLEPHEIHALAGMNNLYTDTGDTAVSGRADPTAVIEKLTNAIIALGGNV